MEKLFHQGFTVFVGAAYDRKVREEMPQRSQG
jgi:hypothetical protein